MKRKDALNAIRFAGYHNDTASFTTLYIENRVSVAAARNAFAQGAQAKAKGVGCGCAECKNATKEQR